MIGCWDAKTEIQRELRSFSGDVSPIGPQISVIWATLPTRFERGDFLMSTTPLLKIFRYLYHTSKRLVPTNTLPTPTNKAPNWHALLNSLLKIVSKKQSVEKNTPIVTRYQKIETSLTWSRERNFNWTLRKISKDLLYKLFKILRCVLDLFFFFSWVVCVVDDLWCRKLI